MFMVCWHYCVTFLHFLLFAISPIMVIAGAFVMKRGYVQYKKNLRQRAFAIWVMAAVKFIIFDIPYATNTLLCDFAGECAPYTQGVTYGLMVTGAAGFAFGFLKLYRIFIPDQSKPHPVRTDLSPIKNWTILSIISVGFFIIWVLGPWISSLTMSGIPQIFFAPSWHYPGILATVCLLMAFWRLEDFQWYYSSTKSRAEHKKDVWVPKDTLWTLVFIHSFTLLMAFASSGMMEDASSSL